MVRSRGFGTVFVVAMGILGILMVMIGVRQFGGLGESTRDAVSAVDVGRKASLVAESAVEEVIHDAFLLDIDAGTVPGDASLHRALRQYHPGAQAPPIKHPFLEGEGFSAMALLEASRTYTLVREMADLSLIDPDPFVCYGIQEQRPFVTAEDFPPSNESLGILAFVHAVTARGSGAFRTMDRAVQFEKEFRVVLTAPPWPFTPYSLFIREADPFWEALRAQYERLQTFFQNNAENPGDSFPPFPFGADASPGPFVVRGEPNIDAAFFGALTFFMGRNPTDTSQFGSSYDIQGLQQKASDLVGKVQGMALDSPAFPDEKERFAGDPYVALGKEVWTAKATHHVKDIAGLIAAAIHPDKEGVLMLSGVYHVANVAPVTLETNWEGYGVIHFDGDVKVRRARNDQASGKGHLVVLSAQNIVYSAGAGDVQADLLAPLGSIQLGSPELAVDGAVLMARPHPADLPARTLTPTNLETELPLALAAWTAFLGKLRIKAPPDALSYKVWKPGGEPLEPRHLKLLRVFIGDGYVRKQFWAKRRFVQ